MASSKGSKRTEKAASKKPAKASVLDRAARPARKDPAAPAADQPSPPAADQPKPPAKWISVQLSSTGEREKDIALIVRSVQRLLGRQVEVFVPAISERGRGESQTMFFMDGYIFVKYEEGASYHRLVDTTFFGDVLTRPGPGRSKEYALLTDKDLAPLRSGMEAMKVGGFAEKDRVLITQGHFKNLPAEVSYVHDGGQVVQVYVAMRSKKVLMDFPASYLQKVNDR